jgi:hypothetical protein
MLIPPTVIAPVSNIFNIYIYIFDKLFCLYL